MNKRAICSIVSLNYYAQALSLMDSVKRYHEDIDLHVLIVDAIKDMETQKMISSQDNKIHNTFVSEIGIEHLNAMEFRYDIVEMNTAAKPYYLEYLLDLYGYENIMYIDADIMLFNRLDTVYELLNQHSILLTPHLLSTEEDQDTSISKIDDFLEFGVYNLGFIALKNDNNGRNLIWWWKNKLTEKSYWEPKKFLAWDQKWMDFAPALFDSVYIIKDPGYNVAFWNIQSRFITKRDEIFYVNEQYKLTFFHFSHYKVERKDRIATLPEESRCMKLSKRVDLQEIFEIYHQNLLTHGYQYFHKIVYAFSQYDNGESIDKKHRRLYQKMLQKKSIQFDNPFITNSENSFYHYIQEQ